MIFCGTKEVEMNKYDCIMQKLTCKKISAWTHMCKISLEEQGFLPTRGTSQGVLIL